MVFTSCFIFIILNDEKTCYNMKEPLSLADIKFTFLFNMTIQ